MVMALGAGQAFAQESTAVSGTNAGAGATGATAGSYATAVGGQASASGDYSIGLGAQTNASGDHSIAQGHATQATGADSIAIGAHDNASGQSSTVVGSRSSVSGDQSSVFGAQASASGVNSVAIGYGSQATEDDVVSVGASGATRRIVNVGEATQDTDAVNLGQLQTSLTTVVGDAAAAAATYTDTRTAAAVVTARTYTDTKAAQTLTAANAYTDWKVDTFAAEYGYKVDRLSDRLDGVGAMSSAMSMMAGNSAGAAAGLTNRLSMAVGGYRGQAAIAAGYTHNARAISVNLGVSATGRDVMSGGSLGFAW
jgi:adhesin YadB/C